MMRPKQTDAHVRWRTVLSLTCTLPLWALSCSSSEEVAEEAESTSAPPELEAESTEEEVSEESTTVIPDFAQYLPAKDLIGLITVRGFTSSFIEFQSELSVITESDEFQTAIKEISDNLGFNPLDMQELMSTGFSFQAPWTVAMISSQKDGEIHPDFITVMPISDPELAKSFLERFWELGDTSFRPIELQGHSGWTMSDGDYSLILMEDHLLGCGGGDDGNAIETDGCLTDCRGDLWLCRHRSEHASDAATLVAVGA